MTAKVQLPDLPLVAVGDLGGIDHVEQTEPVQAPGGRADDVAGHAGFLRVRQPPHRSRAVTVPPATRRPAAAAFHTVAHSA